MELEERMRPHLRNERGGLYIHIHLHVHVHVHAHATCAHMSMCMCAHLREEALEGGGLVLAHSCALALDTVHEGMCAAYARIQACAKVADLRVAALLGRWLEPARSPPASISISISGEGSRPSRRLPARSHLGRARGGRRRRRWRLERRRVEAVATGRVEREVPFEVDGELGAVGHRYVGPRGPGVDTLDSHVYVYICVHM